MSFDKTSAKKLARLFALCLLPLAFQSCEDFFDQVVTIDPPEYEKKMVLNCFQSQLDSSIHVSVSRNVGILETIADSLINLRGAAVEWLESGNVVHLMTVDGYIEPPIQGIDFAWRYYSKKTAAPAVTPGKTYEIRVAHPDYAPISAVQVAPFPPKIDTVTVKLDTTNTGGFFEGTATFAITIDDPAAESNFYEIGIDGGTYSYSLASDDPNARQGLNSLKLLVSDEFFNGKKYILRATNSAVDEDFWRVRVRSVTADYYRFSITAPRNEEANYNPFANPVQVFTNVAGGLGLFGLFGEVNIVVE